MLEGSDIFFGLINNLAIFIALLVVYGILNKALNKTPPVKRQLILGVVFGLFAIACMNIKIQVIEGVFVDQRNTIVALSGAFGGPLTAIISGIMASVYRLSLGGIGIFGGTTGIVLAATAGMFLYRFRAFDDSVPKAAIASFLTAIWFLPGFLPIKDFQTGWALLKQMALPYGTAIFVGVFLLGLLMAHEENRLRTRLALTDSEKRYRDLFNSLIDISYRTDLNGYITVISPSSNTILGYTPEELMGRQAAILFLENETHDVFVNKLKENGNIDNFETETTKKDGSKAWISINARAKLNDKNEVIGSEGMIRDITLLKQSEAKKQELEESLWQSQKMEAVGTLAGGIAHDFNNILGVIFAYTQLASKKIPELPEFEKIKNYLEKIQSAGSRAESMVKQILMFSRKVKFEPQPIELKPLLKESVKFLQASIPSTVKIQENIGPDLKTVIGDYTQIHQVIINLSTNAFHSLEGKSGVLEISLKNFTIERKSAETAFLNPGKYVLLSVRDNGVGMSEETIKRVFDPFFTTKEKGKGTGLGLSVVHGIIQKHNGGIHLYSEPGIGTKVNVYFPVSKLSAEMVKDESVRVIHQGTESIMLLDDEVDIVESYSEIFKLYGYQVHPYTDSTAALKAFEHDPSCYDLIITDYTMPGISGLELCANLLEIKPNLPIILISGLGELISTEEISAAGISRLLSKPIELSRLVNIVRETIDEYSYKTV